MEMLSGSIRYLRSRLPAASPSLTHPRQLARDAETGAFLNTLTVSSRPEHPARPLGADSRRVSLRGRGSASPAKPPRRLQGASQAFPGPCSGIPWRRRTTVPSIHRAAGHRPPPATTPPSGSRLPRFLLHRYR
ncbi:hypothetical protein NN561_011658 [Cricetulus griseus]